MMLNLDYFKKNREYTPEETKINFIANLYSEIDRHSIKDGFGVMETFLHLVDGYSSVPVALYGVSGEEKECLWNDYTDIALDFTHMSEESLNYYVENYKANKGFLRVAPAKRDLVMKMRELAVGYNLDNDKDPHRLMTEILDVVDKGLNGTSFEIRTYSSKEEQKALKKQGKKYYPDFGENIVGNLSELYSQVAEKYRVNETDKETSRKM